MIDYKQCEISALECSNRKEFKSNYPKEYQYSIYHEFYDDISSHFKRLVTKKNSLTFNICQQEALKYKSRTNLLKNKSEIYTRAYNKGWLDDICKHMKRTNGHKIKWTYEKCRECALKCINKTEFINNYRSAYLKCLKNDWLKDLCSHMQIVGNRFSRLVYLCYFINNSVYVGLTYNFEKRKNQHLNSSKSVIYKYCKKTKLKPIFISLTNYISVKQAQKLEESWLNIFKIHDFTILNSNKTGGIGASNLIWTYENCKECALKCKSKNEIKLKYNGAYSSMFKHNWYKELTSHLNDTNKKPNGYWTFERCKEEALKYKVKKDFEKGCVSAYNKCVKNKWLDITCSHMIPYYKYYSI
jgi:predicted GIY-YIG superfamily endonuclease